VDAAVDLDLKRLARIKLDSTGGHPFWVNGEGWRRARTLARGTRLHSVGGAVLINSIEPGPE